MTIAATVTDDEDTLIACLLHDAIEDASEIYGEDDLREDFGFDLFGDSKEAWQAANSWAKAVAHAATERYREA